MKLLIEISEELYETYKGRPPMLGDAGMDMIAQSIANGIPLPKGHGRLIDADSMWNAYHDLDYDFYEAFDLADTIVEADRSEDKDAT